MARGRNYYDPILQAPSRVETRSERRIELYPEHDVRDNAENPKWVARLIDEQGRIVQYSPGSFDHDDALRQAQEMWPGLEVYELRQESDDSTWDGMGPSPRLWQNSAPETGAATPRGVSVPSTGPSSVFPGAEAGAEHLPPAVERSQTQVFAFRVPAPGSYVALEDIVALLENYAAQYDGESNPSAALGLREAASALREAF